MANEELFSAKAADYAAGRLSYAPEAIATLFSRLMKRGQAAADVGSGTGILSREFLARGYTVYAVEPNAAMRREAERQYRSAPGFHSLAASAEATGPPDKSVCLVAAASAFRWFDPAGFAAECRRILTPDGVVCILANARVYDDFAWAQHRLCRRFCPAFTSLNHGAERDAAGAKGFFCSGYSAARFPIQRSAFGRGACPPPLCGAGDGGVSRLPRGPARALGCDVSRRYADASQRDGDALGQTVRMPPGRAAFQRVEKLVFGHAARRQESTGDKQFAPIGVQRYGRGANCAVS